MARKLLSIITALFVALTLIPEKTNAYFEGTSEIETYKEISLTKAAEKNGYIGELVNSFAEKESFGQINETNEGEVLLSGTCGESIQYSLLSNGTLSIDGTGAMYDYDHGLNGARSPWFGYNSDISKIIVSDGITYLGN